MVKTGRYLCCGCLGLDVGPGEMALVQKTLIQVCEGGQDSIKWWVLCCCDLGQRQGHRSAEKMALVQKTLIQVCEGGQRG